jgi:hypothetical protein
MTSRSSVLRPRHPNGFAFAFGDSWHYRDLATAFVPKSPTMIFGLDRSGGHHLVTNNHWPKRPCLLVGTASQIIGCAFFCFCANRKVCTVDALCRCRREGCIGPTVPPSLSFPGPAVGEQGSAGPVPMPRSKNTNFRWRQRSCVVVRLGYYVRVSPRRDSCADWLMWTRHRAMCSMAVA